MFLVPKVGRHMLAHACMHACRSQKSESGVFLYVFLPYLIITIFETRVSHCTYSLPTQLGWLAAESYLPPSLTVGTSDVHHCIWIFMPVLGITTRVHWLLQQALYPWTHLPSPSKALFPPSCHFFLLLHSIFSSILPSQAGFL